jgi:hypothetical protein
MGFVGAENIYAERFVKHFDRASEAWLPNGNAADPLTSAPQKRRPVLFVHGHNPGDANDADFNYRKNWVQVVNGLPSFQLTLDDPANTPTLDIEAYFIRFVDQHRSIDATVPPGDARR